MTDAIKVVRDNGLLTLILDRPDKKNALSDAMYGVLADQIETAQANDDTRVILICAEGDMFTAGNDVGEFAAAAMGGPSPRNVRRFIKALAKNMKPLVAAVQGRAVGVGTTMLLHCDHVVLSEDAQLTTPFVNLALVPEAASSHLLPERIGHLRAFSMFALGEPVGAADAVSWGLANAAVPRADLVATAEAFARRLVSQPLGALMATKRLMRRVDAIISQMDIEGTEFAARLSTGEAREAFTAFAERRKPNFGTVAQ